MADTPALRLALAQPKAATATAIAGATSAVNTAPTPVKPVKLTRAEAGADGHVKIAHAAGDVASVEIADVDLLLQLKNGQWVLVPNGALDALSSHPPQLVFADGSASTSELIKLAGKATAVTAGNVRIITDKLDTEPVVEATTGTDYSPPPAEPAPAPPAPKVTSVKPLASAAAEGAGKGDVPEMIHAPRTVVPPEFRQGKRIENLEDLQIGVPSTTAKLYVAQEFKVTPSGHSDLPVGATDASSTAQAHREVVQGTAAADVIQHNTALAAEGWSAKVLHLDFPNFSNVTTITLKVPNLAFGLQLDGAIATQDPNNPGVWTLTFDNEKLLSTSTSTDSSTTTTTAPPTEAELIALNGLDIKLTYQLAADGDATQTDFPLQVEVHGESGKFGFDVAEIYTFSRREASSAEDFEVLGADGKPIYVLPSHGIGYDIDAGDGNDEVHAGAGADLVLGGAGDDQLYGDAGNDTLEGGTGADLIDGGTGRDAASYEHATSAITVSLDAALGVTGTGDAAGDTFNAVENLFGSAFDDRLIGDSAANRLDGDAGNDVLEGRGGADTLVGGSGDNTASYGHAAAGITAVLGEAIDGVTASGEAAGDTYTQIQNLQGSAHDDALIGDSAANRLDGGAGHDVLEGRAGGDALIGNSGDDTASYAHAGAAVNASLTGNLITASGDAAGDTFDGIENLAGSGYHDQLIGDAAANVLWGGGGNDVLEGLAGADTLVGGTGTNTASYAHAAGAVVASLNEGLVLAQGDAAGDHYVDIQNLSGSAFDDALIGNAQANALSGGAGDDTLEGGELGDSLQGGAGSDTASYAHAASAVSASLTGGLVVAIGEASGDSFNSIENLAGSGFDDTLLGDAGANTLQGDAGDDVLEGLAGADALQGGDGTDTASYAHAQAGVVASLTANQVTALGDAAGDTFTHIENLTGSDHADQLLGDANANLINAGAGDDVLEGGAGSDVLIGGAGSNTASYAHAGSAVSVSLSPGLIAATGDAAGDVLMTIQHLQGSSHNDTLIADNNDNRLDGGAGDDVLEGMAGADALVGGGGQDTASYEHAYSAVTASLAVGLGDVTASGDASGDTYDGITNLSGSSFGDTLIGDSQANTLSGRAGDDVLEGGAGADALLGGSGRDTASYAHAASGITVSLDASLSATGDAAGDSFDSIENLEGSHHDDLLVGDANTNTLSGGDGDDVLQGRGGADALIGGAGTDTASYSQALAGVNASLTTGLGDISSAGEAQGDTYSGIDNLQGSAYADTLVGDSADNRLEGGAGDDILEGLAGNDRLVGGAGHNTASYAHATAGVSASLTAGMITATGHALGDLYEDIQDLAGSEYADTLVGDAGANLLKGNAGNDTLEGLAGADALQGGAGIDIASYLHAGSAITLSLDGSLTATGDAAGDVLDSIEGLSGSAYADHLRGDAGNNTLIGNAGDDLLEGGSGADALQGGAGIDTASYADAASAVTASLTSGLVVAIGDATGDSFDGIENLTGSAYDDTLIGNAGANRLTGGAGNDVLEGLAGADALEGGSGDDTASYAHALAAVHASLTEGLISASGDAEGDSYDSIEHLTGSDYADQLIGNTGNNALSGGAGDDVLQGLGGADTLLGGAGTNVASYEHAAAGVTVSLSSGLVGNTGDAAGDQFFNIQGLQGSAFNDTLLGDNLDNTLDGGLGDDVLEGMAGADALVGGGGNDTASYLHGASAVAASLTAGLITTSGDAVGDVYTGISNLAGSNFADTLIGDAGANTLSGNAGEDVLEGLAGADALIGGAGTDTASYSHATGAVRASLDGSVTATGDALGDSFTSIENLQGSAYNDELTGDANANTLTGGIGDDQLEGRAGADALIGGSGSDTASYSQALAGIVASLTTGLSDVTPSGDAAGDSYSSVEHLLGSAHDDQLVGDAGNNTLSGSAGDDVLEGLAGSDTLQGGTGTNTASYAHANAGVTATLTSGLLTATGHAVGDVYVDIQALAGSDYADTLAGDSSANTLTGNAGNDTLEGLAGADALQGGTGTDTASYAHATSGVTMSLDGSLTATGDAAGDVLSSMENLAGSAHADHLRGDDGANTLAGADGDDLLEGGGGADALQGGDGSDTASYGNATSAVTASLTSGLIVAIGDAAGDSFDSIENLTGSNSGDTLIGNASANTISGGAGNDLLEGLGGADALDGGDGIDTASYAHAAAGVTASLTAGQVAALGDALGDTLTNIENLTGSDHADQLIGNASANVLAGGDGNDVLEGRAGADTLAGGAGSNTASYEHAAAAVTATLTTSLVTATGDAAGDSYSNIQHLIGSTFNDTLIGDINNNTLSGGLGDDVLEGMSGADTLVGGGGSDTASYEHSFSAVTATLTNGTGTLTGDALGDTYSAISNLAGSNFADSLVGDANANSLTGNAGDDVLEGLAGADTLTGGQGNDTASYSHATSAVRVSLDGSVTATGDAEGDVLSTLENLLGSNFNDQLTGDANANTLTGGAGDDQLEGKGGADSLIGGSGSDTASYSQALAGVVASLTTGLSDVAQSGDAAGDTFSSIEHLSGSGFDDTLIGDANANTLTGGAGDDVLEGLAGSDMLQGGTGTNTASYAHANAAVNASLTGSLLTATGHAVGDTYSAIQNLTGSDYADTLIGDSGANTLTGNAGNDTLEGLAGADALVGGAGTDTASYAHAAAGVDVSLDGSLTATGDAAGDSFSSIENLSGSAQADRLRGDENANTLTGADGDDILEGGSGGDALQGGDGSDTASYGNATSAVTASLTSGLIVAIGDAAGDSFDSIENLTGSNSGDTLIGNASANTISGGAGNDLLEGLGGADALDGGDGIDTASYAHAAAGVQVSLTAALIAATGDALGDTLTNIENLTGSDHADQLIGNASANVLAGGDGNDVLEGRAGADTLAGGAGSNTASYEHAAAAVTATLTTSLVTATGDAAGDSYSNIQHLIGSTFNDTLIGDINDNTLSGGLGNDVLEGMSGADTLVGGGGSDTASYEHSFSAVTATLTSGTGTLTGDALGDTYSAISNLAGSNFADSLVGDANANVLTGNAGDDVLEGLAGADTLTGGSGTDTASYSHATSAVRVSLDGSVTATGDAEGDVLSTLENLLGSDFNDQLTGDANANTLTGGAGDDQLEGKGGADSLIGGTGSDTASYSQALAGVVASLTTGLSDVAQSGDAAGDTFSSIEHLSGSAQADTLIGDANANTLTGGAGDDVLEGLAGSDMLQGGTGTNTASYAHANAAVNASLTGSLLTATGHAVGDTYSAIQNLTGSDYADQLIGDSGANTLTGNAGNDTLEGLAGADALVGGAGTDTASYAHAAAGVDVSLDGSLTATGDAAGDSFNSIENLSGSAQADRLRGDENANTLAGSDGDDTLEGGSGGDALQGGDGSDTASYGNATSAVTASLTSGLIVAIGDAAGDSFDSIENLTGSNSGDTLIGNASANVISGGAGNDLLEGLGGADALDGGDGIDTASYAHAATGVTASLTAGQVAALGDALGDTLTNIENLTGSDHADQLIGNASANVLAGGDGNDVLEGRAGADTLAGGAGSNTASYEHAAAAVTATLTTSLVTATGDAAGDSYSNIQHLIGSASNDTLIGDINNNTLSGGLGDDVLEGMSGADTLVGGGGSDTASYEHSFSAVTATLTNGTGTLTGDALGDTYSAIANLAGSNFADSLVGSSAANVLTGNAGDDVLEGLAGADTLTGGQGTDTASYSHATSAVRVSLDGSVTATGDALGDTLASIENVLGSDFNDTLVGDSNANVLTGGTGDDELQGRGGADSLIGGSGSDTASYSQALAGVVASLTTGLSDITPSGDAAGDTFNSIEHLAGSGQADTLIGDAGANTLSGGAGDDTLEGMAGADMLQGGTGTNTASYAHANAAVNASLTSGLLTATGHAVGDTYSNIQNLTGSDYADQLAGDGGDNVLTGNAGNDVLEGLAGADTLSGGLGQDTASYAYASSGVTQTLDGSLTATGDAAGDVLSSIENLTGSAAADHFIGDGNSNVLAGGDGDDELEGAGGADTLQGGDGTDTASYAHAASAVTASLTSSLVVAVGDASGDSFSSIENLTGSDHSDTLLGDANANVITGGAGNDLLEGLAGSDTLDGGDGIDTASYAHASAGVAVSLTNGLSGFTAAGDAQGDTLTAIENLTGSDHADTLIGDSTTNTLTGGAGDDTLEGLGGADALVGGSGSNTASYAHAGAAVTASLSGVVSNGGDAAGDTYSSIQNLLGSDHNDTLVGDTNDNTLSGGLGNDVLEGLGGADALVGGGGSDTASYEHSYNVIVAALTSGLSGITVTGDALGDSYTAIANLTGSNLADTLVGDVNANVLTGLAGDDVLEGLGGADTLIGGTGTNTASYAHSSTAVLAALTAGTYTFGSGTVTVSLAGSALVMASVSAGVDIGDALGDSLTAIVNLTGSANADTLIGDAQANTLSGGAGNDLLEGRAGADALLGGDGIDTASYDHAASGVSASLTVGLSGFLTTGDAAGDTYGAIENLIGSSAADTLIGDSADNVLTGNGGDDVLEGMAGADTLMGSASASVTASYAHATSGVVASLTSGLSGITNSGDAAGDSYTNINNLAGSAYADTLVGNAQANVLTGNNGNDMLEGLGGADTLDGGAGTDTASYAHATAAVVISLDGSLTATGDAAGDTLVSIESLVGSDYGDTLTGDVNANALSGGAGNDLLEGRGGADAFDGGDGTDTATYAHATSGVAVGLASGVVTSSGEAAGDTFTAVENLVGSTYADTLVGDGSANVITGNGGADEIEGGAGGDTLSATAGSGSTLSFAHAGAAVVYTFDGSLTATGDAVSDTVSGFDNLRGSAYNDTLRGDSNDNIVSGGAGNDTLWGNAGNDTLNGEDGNDTLYAGLGIDSVDAGNGDDTVLLSSGGDILDGGTGTDTLSAASLATEGYRIDNYNFTTGVLNYRLISSGATVSGGTAINFENIVGSGSYQETFLAGVTSNNIDGVGGNDWLSYHDSYRYTGAIAATGTATTSTRNDGVLVDMVARTATSLNATYAGAGGTDTFANIGNIYGTAYGDDILLGDAANNWIGGYRGRDFINGAGGTDTWVMENETGPLNGASYILGSLTPLAGINDQAAAITYGLSSTYYSQISTTTSATLGWSLSALPNVTWGATNDFLANMENVYGTGQADWIIGSATNNTLNGNGGSDVLEGLGGADTLNGGGSSGDTVTYEHATSSVIVSLSAFTSGAPGGNTVNGVTFTTSGGYVVMTGASAGDANGDRLAGFYNITGSAFNDTLIGNGNNNTLTGGSGNDVLEGGGGTSDTLVGGAGIDYASYLHSTNTSGLVISLLNPALNSGDGVGDNYSGIEGLVGSSYNDTLYGDNGANYLVANLGNDTVVANGDNDSITVSNASANMVASLSGGAGTDTVVIQGLVSGAVSASNTLNTLAGKMTTIETLDIRTDGVGSTVYLGQAGTSAASYVQSMVGNGTASQLTINANGGSVIDVLSLTLGAGEALGTTAVTGGTDYTITNSLGSTIAVIHWQTA